MVLMNIANEKRFAHSCRHAHCGYGNARTDTEADISCEVDVGERISKERIIILNVKLNGLFLYVLQIVTGNALCYRIKQLIIRDRLEILGNCLLQAYSVDTYFNEVMNKTLFDRFISHNIGEHILDVYDIDSV